MLQGVLAYASDDTKRSMRKKQMIEKIRLVTSIMFTLTLAFLIWYLKIDSVLVS